MNFAGPTIEQLDLAQLQNVGLDHDHRQHPQHFKPRVYYIHANSAGAPEELTDSDGHVVWQARYQSWGNVALQAQLGRDPNPHALPKFKPEAQTLRLQGQYADTETGLYYNTFRYYDPDVGRFISQDPIGLAGGINLYQYGPNPLGWVDPWGWVCWATARKDFWRKEARSNPLGYSSSNLQRMRGGLAPRLKVEVLKRGQRIIKDVSMELHHTNVPQRLGGTNVHSTSNLTPLTPWQHEAVDPFRNTGEVLLKVTKDVSSW